MKLKGLVGDQKAPLSCDGLFGALKVGSGEVEIGSWATYTSANRCSSRPPSACDIRSAACVQPRAFWHQLIRYWWRTCRGEEAKESRPRELVKAAIPTRVAAGPL
jgi:hypothetical protein